MNIKQARITIIILVSTILLRRISIDFLFYIGFIYISLEFLNSKKLYLSQKNYKKINLVFIIFSIFEILYRGFGFMFIGSFYSLQNRIEHIIFSTILSLLFFQLSRIYISSSKRQIVSTLILINTFGTLNEIFQVFLRYKVFEAVTSTYLKDILLDLTANILGATIFIVLFTIFSSYKYYKLKKINSEQYSYLPRI